LFLHLRHSYNNHHLLYNCTYVFNNLADGADPNLRYEDDHNQSPLHAAAGMGHHLITHLLLQAGASPHVLDNSLSTPIILAAEKANMQILQILVKSGGLVDARVSSLIFAVGIISLLELNNYCDNFPDIWHPP